MKVERNDELSALYAEAVANIVHVTLADGRTLTKRVDYPLGNAKNRLKDSEVEGKFHSLADAKIGKERADRVVEPGWKLDEAKDVTTLMKSLCDRFGVTDAKQSMRRLRQLIRKGCVAMPGVFNASMGRQVERAGLMRFI